MNKLKVIVSDESDAIDT